MLAIINSDALQQAVTPLMSRGSFGARDLHRHLWKLPIPEFDPIQKLHAAIADAGAKAVDTAGKKLEELREQREGKLTVTVVRRELRRWLRASAAQFLQYNRCKWRT